MKKIVAVMLAVLLISALCVPAFAASDINADEQRVLDAVAEVVTSEEGAKMSLKDADINQAKNFLMRDEIDLNKADADEIIANIEKCFDIVTKAELKSEKLTDMSEADRQALLAAANDAGAPVNVTVSYDAAANKVEFTYAGAVIATVDPVIKFTGAEYTMLFAILGAAVLAVLAAAVVVKKTAVEK